MTGADLEPVDTVVFDMDGTLVDTVYQHTMAWVVAFDEVEVVVPVWRIHRAIGIGGDRLVAEVAGQEVETAHGDALRERHDQLFGETLDEIHPLPGAADLLADLRTRGLRVVLATSGLPEHTDRLLDLVGGTGSVDDVTTASEAENSKPAPDTVEVAVDKVAGSRVAMVGDAVWDVIAAKAAGHYSVGLLSGGFGEDELRGAGADAVHATPQALLEALDTTVLRGPAQGC